MQFLRSIYKPYTGHYTEWNMRLSPYHVGIIVASVLVIFFSSIFPYFRINQIIPGGSAYGFMMPHQQDYFQYVTMIRQGKENKEVLYNNPFDYRKSRSFLVHPFYMMIGNIARYIRLDQFHMYALTRFVCCVLFILVVYLICRKLFPQPQYQLLTMLLFFSTTAVWKITSCYGVPCIENPTADANTYFSAYYRFINLPPHHYAAIIVFMLFLLHIPSMTTRIRSILTTGILSSALVLLHPYYALNLSVIVTVYSIFRVIRKRNMWLLYLTHGVIFFVPALLYFFYMNRFSASLNTTGAIVIPPLSIVWGVPFIEYIHAIGVITLPVLLFGIFSRFHKWNAYHGVLVLWAACVSMLYYLPYANIIFGNYRIFQNFPQIPFIFLGAQGLIWLIIKYKRIGTIVSTVYVLLSIIYVIPVFWVSLQFLFSPANPQFYQYNLIKTVQFLNPALRQYTPANSVLLTGELSAPMFTAITNNRVITAPNASTVNFENNWATTQRFYWGGLSETEVKTFLANRNVQAIVFGFDAGPIPTQYQSFPFFKKVYEKDGISIVTVEM